MGLFSPFRLLESAAISERSQALQLRGGASNRSFEPAHIAANCIGFARTWNCRPPEAGASQFLVMLAKPRSLIGLGRSDTRIQFAIALLMVFERRDVFVTQHGRHPHIQMRYGPDAAFLADAVGTEILAQTGI